MADTAVETPVGAFPLTKKATFSSIPTIDSLEGVIDGEDEYATLKKLQRHLEYRWLDKVKTVLTSPDISIYKRSISRTNNVRSRESSSEHRKKSKGYKVCRW